MTLERSPAKFAFIVTGILVILLVGLRHEIGPDWDNYVAWYKFAQDNDLFTTAFASDPGYMTLNWILAQLDLSIYAVNVLCALVFSLGLFRYCAKEPLPWLALLLATPYFIIVVAMNYTRQSVAIGLFLCSLLACRSGNTWRAIAFLVFATLFHKSVIVFAFILALQNKISLPRLFLIFAGSIFLGYVMLEPLFDMILKQYIEFPMESGGALFRVALNGSFAVLFILFVRKSPSFRSDANLLFSFSLLSIVALLFVDIASTFVDRLSLYLMPLQLSVLPRLISLHQDNFTKHIAALGVGCFSFFTLWIFMIYSPNAPAFVPYKFIFEN